MMNEGQMVRLAIMGPARVVVDRSGRAVPPDQASERGIAWDVIFVRRDGWTLGAPARLAKVAFRMWEGEWVKQINC